MNRILVIAGSTRGIGFSTAIELLKSGDRVVIFCRHKGHVMKAASQLAGHGEGQNILGLAGDVRREEEVRAVPNGLFIKQDEGAGLRG